MNLSAVLTTLSLDDDADLAALAVQVVDQLRSEINLDELLAQFVLQAIRVEKRRRVRALEHDASHELRNRAHHATHDVPDAADRPDPYDTIRASQYHLKKLIANGSWRDHGQTIRWADATVDQHMARVERLRKQYNGIGQTINNHLAAVDIISTNGAATLGELDLP